MPTFSSLLSSANSASASMFERSPRHATYNFNQGGQSLFVNQPRLPFEYYININLNQVDTAKLYIDKFFNNVEWQQVQPLIKSVEMPSMKIETTPINQYNRKRLSQTAIKFEPVKMVFHDVADGKTLKFWEMYYRYYFLDGSEPGQNSPVSLDGDNSNINTETIQPGISPAQPASFAGQSASTISSYQSNTPTGSNSSTNTNGQKRSIQNIISNTLDNHNFGFNLPTVNNIRNLIQTIEIFQVHGGKFNSVTLVNPRVAAFTHDVLNYAIGDKTLEITLTFEYEYAYYSIDNMDLGNPGNENNNNSSMEQFLHGDYLESPSMGFNLQISDLVTSSSSVGPFNNPVMLGVGKNVQSSLGSVTNAFSGSNNRRVSASSLSGMVQVSPEPYLPDTTPPITSRSFASTAKPDSNQYPDMNRAGNSNV